MELGRRERRPLVLGGTNLELSFHLTELGAGRGGSSRLVFGSHTTDSYQSLVDFPAQALLCLLCTLRIIFRYFKWLSLHQFHWGVGVRVPCAGSQSLTMAFNLMLVSLMVCHLKVLF